MFYIEITFEVTLIILSLILLGKNLARKKAYIIHYVFSLICLALALMAGALLFYRFFPEYEYSSIIIRYYFASLILISLFYFILSLIFPPWEKKPPFWFIILITLPGLALFVMTLIEKGIVVYPDPGDVIKFEFGPIFRLYMAILAFNLSGIIASTIYRIISMSDASFKRQIIMLSMVHLFSALVFLLSYIVAPFIFSNFNFHVLGVTGAATISLLANDFILETGRPVDFTRFLERALYWSFMFALLVVPVYFFIQYRQDISIFGQYLTIPGEGIVIFAYCFFLYRIVGPYFDKLLRRKHIRFEQTANEFFENIATISLLREQDINWDSFYNNFIDELQSSFGFKGASFYMYNPSENVYKYTHGFGDEISIKTIEEANELVKAFKVNSLLIEKSMLYRKEIAEINAENLLYFFNANNIEAAFPLNTYDQQLIAILLIGRHSLKKNLSTELISSLELYRIHFEISLANSIFLEKIKSTQITLHDQMLIQRIKEEIIPEKMHQIKGIRISSLYINNSENGGDYFDSCIIKPDKIGIFISSTSNDGVSSGVLGLQLYTVFHTQSAHFENPEKLLNIINWVITSSRFSETYAPSLYAVISPETKKLHISNAAMNPIVLFDRTDEVFLEIDTKGIPLGIDKNFAYESKSIQLTSGTIGYLYSDGLENLVNAVGESYPLSRIKTIILEHKNDTPALLVRKVYSDLEEFTGGLKSINDVSMIIFRVA